MKLFHNPASPFARKVAIVLHETGRAGEVELVTVAGHPTAPGTMPVAQNPLGKVPALVRESGPALYDSRVICRYLDDLAGGTLYPKGEALWEALTLEATGDGMMDAAVLMIYESRSRPEALRHEPWVEGQWAKVSRALEALESRWMANLAAPFDIGQISILCALGYLDFRHTGRDWRSGHPELAAWFAKISDRPSVKATVPAG